MGYILLFDMNKKTKMIKFFSLGAWIPSRELWEICGYGSFTIKKGDIAEGVNYTFLWIVGNKDIGGRTNN